MLTAFQQSIGAFVALQLVARIFLAGKDSMANVYLVEETGVSGGSANPGAQSSVCPPPLPPRHPSALPPFLGAGWARRRGCWPSGPQRALRRGPSPRRRQHPSCSLPSRGLAGAPPWQCLAGSVSQRCLGGGGRSEGSRMPGRWSGATFEPLRRNGTDCGVGGDLGIRVLVCPSSARSSREPQRQLQRQTLGQKDTGCSMSGLVVCSCFRTAVAGM